MALSLSDRRLLKRVRVLASQSYTLARAAARIVAEIEAADFDGRSVDAALIERRVRKIETTLRQQARALGVEVPAQ